MWLLWEQGFYLVCSLMNSQCPEQYLPNIGHSWWDGEVKWEWLLRDMLRHIIHVDMPLSWADSSHRKHLDQKWSASWWIVHDGAFRLPQLLGFIHLVEFALLQLWASWTESEVQGSVNSCEVHSRSPRISAGCFTEAVITVLCQISGPTTAGQRHGVGASGPRSSRWSSQASSTLNFWKLRFS